MVAAGLFSDPLIYREGVALFYVVTKELEKLIKSSDFPANLLSKDEREVFDKIATYAKEYYFTKDYEKDMTHLFSAETWETEIQELLSKRPHAQAFVDHVRAYTTASELAAGVFCLWGALIIGGGAGFRRRAQALYGDKALNLFGKVSGPGREGRRRDFIAFFDSLAEPETALFDKITQDTIDTMHKSNAMLQSMSANPW